jgi:hypothetical protein
VLCAAGYLLIMLLLLLLLLLLLPADQAAFPLQQ